MVSSKTLISSLVIITTVPSLVVGWSHPSAPHNDQAPITRRHVFATALTAPLVAVPLVAQAKDLSEEYRQGTLALQDMDDQAPVPREAYVRHVEELFTRGFAAIPPPPTSSP